MQCQAVPLSRSEKYIVGTGLERQAALDSGALALAERAGKIIYIDTDKILFSGNGDTLSIPSVMYQRSNKNTYTSHTTLVLWNIHVRLPPLSLAQGVLFLLLLFSFSKEDEDFNSGVVWTN
ncbi:UNVERIFIED_CONTAM: DNA-directed RNA polymerase subunit beta [Sesamum latifolium]|uniref:DNA-directed RNA polymerase subunit beta n=1 Tax=Sesamum latifolium TaxID=2727402 RepID=A0AAW2TLM3_9LAMI